jgi:hypothetical protein
MEGCKRIKKGFNLLKFFTKFKTLTKKKELELDLNLIKLWSESNTKKKEKNLH